ncbi:MAG: hypothetical protein JRD68_16390, partial [Deltaproteobacteria bacterium]|nr:hypothetical protein [Deltaproteobacteria bacterium]
TKAEVGRIEAEAVGKLKTYEDRMNVAREEALARRVEARDEATARAREIMNRANTEAHEHISAIHAEAAKAVQDVKIELTDFKESIAELVLTKIIGREVQ